MRLWSKESDLEAEEVLRRRLRSTRPLRGEGLRLIESDLLRFRAGERDLERSDGVEDLRRVPRAGLLPLPLLPLPR